MSIRPGTRVRHPDLGRGVLKQLLGRLAVVEFYGEPVEVAIEDLTAVDKFQAEALDGSHEAEIDRILFRRAVEAINLGVVPPHPDQLLALSIHGSMSPERLRRMLDDAKQKGLTKVFFGDYG